jgi:hypothetical protein
VNVSNLDIKFPIVVLIATSIVLDELSSISVLAASGGAKGSITAIQRDTTDLKKEIRLSINTILSFCAFNRFIVFHYPN